MVVVDFSVSAECVQTPTPERPETEFRAPEREVKQSKPNRGSLVLGVRHMSKSGQVEKPKAQREKTERRLKAHKSLKPPQAALRERDELRRWYDSKTASALQDELRKREIKFVWGRKAEWIQLLVEDDKKVIAKD